MYEFNTYLPPGPIQYMFTQTEAEISLAVKTLIIKPTQRLELLPSRGRDECIRVAKEHGRFIKRRSVFWNRTEASTELFSKACKRDFELADMYLVSGQ